MIVDEFYRTINRYFGNELTFIWDNQLSILAEIDTSYETDNGYELESSDYFEYYAVAIKIKKLLFKGELYQKNEQITEGKLMEVSLINAPDKVLFKGETIWNICENEKKIYFDLLYKTNFVKEIDELKKYIRNNRQFAYNISEEDYKRILSLKIKHKYSKVEIKQFIQERVEHIEYSLWELKKVSNDIIAMGNNLFDLVFIIADYSFDEEISEKYNINDFIQYSDLMEEMVLEQRNNLNLHEKLSKIHLSYDKIKESAKKLLNEIEINS